MFNNNPISRKTIIHVYSSFNSRLVSLSIPRKPEHILAPSTDEAEGSEESSSDTEF